MGNKTPVSNAQDYAEIGEFWDNHDATEWGEETPVDFLVNIKSQQRYYPVDNELVLKLRHEAQNHGVSSETLINMWLQEKLSLAIS